MSMMAQHHHKQQTHQVSNHEGANNKPNRRIEDLNKHFRQPTEILPIDIAKASSREETTKIDLRSNQNTHSERHQRSQCQDGKRTLIKNQLYLIEQLQVENANLRNERDQLRLENEELKFQLQMISSSNILGQPSTAFNDDRPLQSLVENIHHSSTVTDNLTIRQRGTLRTINCISSSDNFHSTGGQLIKKRNDINDQHIITPSLSLTKLTATPLRSAKRSNDLQSESLQLNDTNGRQDAGCKSRSETNSVSDSSPGTELQPASSSKRDQQRNRSLKAKSTSMSAFNIRVELIPASLSSLKTDNLLTIDHDEEDDEQQLVQQLYGDSEKVHAAAVTIQRAFRKHQICQRFRRITEQLRHARKCSPSHHYGGDHLAKDRSCNQQTPKERENEVKISNVPSTRAAAWESLSQAASRLAASAASATASTKQAFSNGVTKSASCQQVVTTNRFQPTRQSKPILSTTTVSSISASDRLAQSKTSSVVAAAINFQQLESIRKRQYRVSLNVFNKNPEKGISFLIAHSFIDCSPPYEKTSHSYYLSNQLHFIDKQKLTAQQQSITSYKDPILGNRLDQNCRICHEEENLKRNIAHFLLHRKGLAKEKIGQYLGNLQCKFNQDVLRYYLNELDFSGLQVDVALRKFSSTMRMPGEAQKIERLVDCFAQRYVQCQQLQQTANDFANPNQALQLSTNDGLVGVGNDWTVTNQANDVQSPMVKNNLTLLTKDEIFILTFAIIMLNTDLHSPSLKSSSRMSAHQFINNLRGVFKSQTINETDLIEIYERVKANQITTSPDHVTHVMKVQQGLTTNNFQKKELPNLCVPHRRLVCFCRLFEVYDINKKERVGQHQREIFLFNDMLLVTKLSRRPRANSPQQYVFRQSIPLQGLQVQLFQSNHYNFGIRLSRRSNDEALIMFNARNELDLSRFVDDLNESIAEMDEMEAIKEGNLIDTMHAKQQERLRRHAIMHDAPICVDRQSGRASCDLYRVQRLTESASGEATKESHDDRCSVNEAQDNAEITIGSSEYANITVIPNSSAPRLSDKFSSMSNLTIKDEDVTSHHMENGLRQNRSFVQKSQQVVLGGRKSRDEAQGKSSQPAKPLRRSLSTNSVHSLDSGLFLSRDVSPNQSG